MPQPPTALWFHQRLYRWPNVFFWHKSGASYFHIERIGEAQCGEVDERRRISISYGKGLKRRDFDVREYAAPQAIHRMLFGIKVPWRPPF